MINRLCGKNLRALRLEHNAFNQTHRERILVPHCNGAGMAMLIAEVNDGDAATPHTFVVARLCLSGGKYNRNTHFAELHFLPIRKIT